MIVLHSQSLLDFSNLTVCLRLLPDSVVVAI